MLSLLLCVALAATLSPTEALLLDMAGLSPPIDGPVRIEATVQQPSLDWHPSPRPVRDQLSAKPRGAPDASALRKAALQDLWVFFEATGELTELCAQYPSVCPRDVRVLLSEEAERMVARGRWEDGIQLLRHLQHMQPTHPDNAAVQAQIVVLCAEFGSLEAVLAELDRAPTIPAPLRHETLKAAAAWLHIRALREPSLRGTAEQMYAEAVRRAPLLADDPQLQQTWGAL